MPFYTRKQSVRMLIEKLLERRIIVGNCWRFNGAHNDEDYGHTSFEGKVIAVHRLSAFLSLGLDLDSDRLVCHKDDICKFKDCWNPLHLYIGSESTNQQDRIRADNHNKANITHCGVCGTELAGNNLYEKGGKRFCRRCRSDRQQEYIKRKRQQLRQQKQQNKTTTQTQQE